MLVAARGRDAGRPVLWALLWGAVVLGAAGWVFAADLLAEGRSLLEAQRYDLAREKLVAFLNAHPGDPEALFLLARVEPDGPKSQEYLQRIVDEAPQHELADDALAQIADYYYARGYYVTAQKHYLRVVQDYAGGDQSDKARFRIGQTYLALKKPAQARQALEELASQRRGSVWAVHANAALVDAYLLEEDWENAVSLAEELVADEAYKDLKAYLLKDIAEGYTRLGRDGEAKAALQRIRVECPNSFEESRLSPGIQAPGAVVVPVDSLGRFAVQAGAFGDSTNAAALLDLLAGQGFSTRLSATPLDSPVLWRVRIGPYRTRAEAELVASLIRLPGGTPPRVIETAE